MTDIKRIFISKKIANQSSYLELPLAFTQKFPELSSKKSEHIFARYIDTVADEIAGRIIYVDANNQVYLSTKRIRDKASSFQYNGKRMMIWDEFKDIAPFIKELEKGSNLTGRLTKVEIDERMINKALAAVSDEALVQQLFSGDIDISTAEWVPVDLENLTNYVENCDYDLAHNAAGKSNNWTLKVRRNRRQAELVLRVARALDGKFPQVPKPSIYGRTYYHGLSIQTMSKDVRSAALGAHFQYDLSAAIYGIKLAIINDISRYRLNKPQARHIENDLSGFFSYTKEYLQEKDAIRNRLAKECITGTNISYKGKLKIVKDAITAIGFGAKTEFSVWNVGFSSAMSDIIMNKDDRERFLNDKFVANFIEEQKQITDLIVSYLKEEEMFDHIKEKIRFENDAKRLTNAHVLAYFFQHYETALMDDIVDIAQAQTPVIARIHDAFITKEKLSASTLEAIKDRMEASHSLLKLDTESVAKWQRLEDRKRNDAAKAFEEQHRRDIEADEAFAKEFISYMAKRKTTHS